jgi:hypothetical protein
MYFHPLRLSFEEAPSFPRTRESSGVAFGGAASTGLVSSVFALGAGTRPGGRGTFLLHDKKVPKEACPAVSALRASRCCTPENGRGRKLAAMLLRHRPRTAPFSAAHQRLDRRGLAHCCDLGRLRTRLQNNLRHSRARGNPELASDSGRPWIPACAGMTEALNSRWLAIVVPSPAGASPGADVKHRRNLFGDSRVPLYPSPRVRSMRTVPHAR